MNSPDSLVAGCVHGRFQPPHKEHLQYIMAAKEKVNKLIIGITQPNPAALAPCDINPHRQERSSNPMSYEERCEAISLMLVESGLRENDYEFMPFPIDDSEKLSKLLSKDIICFTTIRDEWNLHKVSILKDLGYNVDVLWDKRGQAGIAGTLIRQQIRQGLNDWQNYVHPSVVDYLINKKIVDRIRSEI